MQSPSFPSTKAIASIFESKMINIIGLISIGIEITLYNFWLEKINENEKLYYDNDFKMHICLKIKLLLLVLNAENSFETKIKDL